MPSAGNHLVELCRDLIRRFARFRHIVCQQHERAEIAGDGERIHHADIQLWGIPTRQSAPSG